MGFPPRYIDHTCTVPGSAKEPGAKGTRTTVSIPGTSSIPYCLLYHIIGTPPHQGFVDGDTLDAAKLLARGVGAWGPDRNSTLVPLGEICVGTAAAVRTTPLQR